MGLVRLCLLRLHGSAASSLSTNSATKGEEVGVKGETHFVGHRRLIHCTIESMKQFMHQLPIHTSRVTVHSELRLGR